MTSGLWFDFIVGSSIILIPLAILIVTIARDLSLEYEGISQRIAKLNSAYRLITNDRNNSSINSIMIEFDDQDNKLIRDSAKEIGAKNCIKDGKIESIMKAMGMLPGTTIVKKSSTALSGPIILEKNGVQFAIGKSTARKIIVKPLAY